MSTAISFNRQSRLAPFSGLATASKVAPCSTPSNQRSNASPAARPPPRSMDTTPSAFEPCGKSSKLANGVPVCSSFAISAALWPTAR
jgi:hypothetical protein